MVYVIPRKLFVKARIFVCISRDRLTGRRSFVMAANVFHPILPPPDQLYSLFPLREACFRPELTI